MKYFCRSKDIANQMKRKPQTEKKESSWGLGTEAWSRHLGVPLAQAVTTVGEKDAKIRATIQGGVINSRKSF